VVGKADRARCADHYRDVVVGFCNPGCRDKFEAATKHFDKAVAERDVPLMAKGL
jgi:hypothetical protein